MHSGHWDVEKSEIDHFQAWSLAILYMTFTCSSPVLAILKATCSKWLSYKMEENYLTHARFFPVVNNCVIFNFTEFDEMTLINKII